MINKLLFFIIGLILFVPIFYIALCLYMEFDILNSFYILPNIYEGLQQGKQLKLEVYLSFVWASILPLFSLFLILQSRKSSAYGRARFAVSSDLKNMGLNLKKGFILAKFKNKSLCFDNGLSALIVAAPGTGKTSSIAIPNLLTIKTSCIVLDIKGELKSLTSSYRKEVLKNKVFVFNPFSKSNTFFFNPFDKDILVKLDFDERITLVKQLATILFPKSEKGSESHWRESAKDLFVFFAMYDIEKHNQTFLCEINRYPKKSAEELLTTENLEELYNLQAEGIVVDELNYFFKQASDDDSLDPLVRNQARSLSRVHYKELKSVITTFSRTMDVFNDYRVMNATSKMSFRYEELRRKNITLYIVVKEKDIDTLSPLIRILYEAIGKNLLDEENNNPDERIYFINDEFTRFGKLEFLLELPTLSRSYNIPGIYITQTEAQIEKYYSKEDLRIITGSVAYRAYFSVNDNETAKRVAEEIGDYTREKVSESSQANKLLGSKNRSREGYKLLTPQDLMNLRKDEILILALGARETPIKAQANYYFKNKKLKKIIKKYAKKELR